VTAKVGSKLPSAVMAHQPNGKLPGSVCMSQDQIKCAHAMTLLGKFRLSRAYFARRPHMIDIVHVQVESSNFKAA
jgi:hypothetical protein